MPQERRVFEFNAGDVMWLVSGVIVAADCVLKTEILPDTQGS
jgi:hypothetical protein